jgi:Tfp pilus assembly protein PilZ
MSAPMSRRRSTRRPRRVSVQFWKQGDPHPFPGFTTNISMTGMFIGTRSPLPPGTRLRIEVLSERGFVVEGLVVHAHKIAPEMAQIAQSGMGVRFLSVEELMQEVLPGLAGKPAPPPPAGEDTEEVPEPPRPAAPSAPQATVASPPPGRPVPPAAPAAPALATGPGVFIVRFPTPQQFLDVFERDLKNGGLFVSTRFPGRLSEIVTIELHPPDAEPLVVRARVVQRFEPNGPNPIAGMGVELVDAQGVYDRLRPLAVRLGAR